MNAIERAKQIVSANEWDGDMRVNFTTIHDAGRVLAKHIDELEAKHASLVAEVGEAFEPFRKALEANDTDTMGSLCVDHSVLFRMAGSWTKSHSVTLGELRRLARAVKVMR